MHVDEDNDSDALPRRGEDCPYYRPMSVLESRRSRPDESRHRNTDKRLTVLARQTQITRVYFCYKSAQCVHSSGISGACKLTFIELDLHNLTVTLTLTLTESVDFF